MLGSEARPFVPLPLPPKLDYDASLATALAEASLRVGELAGLGRQLINPRLLSRPFIRTEAVLSSRIEGTNSTVADLYAFEADQVILPGLSQTQRKEDVQEVRNYEDALRAGLERLSTLPMSLRFLRELHERLMTGVRGGDRSPGEFRRIQNWIGPPGSTLETATYVPPAIPQMHAALAEFEVYLQQDVEREDPPLVRLAFIHYQFEAIHPFLDGNGRVGRLLIVLLLVHWDLLPHPLLYPSAYFERHRSTYYDLLRRVSTEGAWKEWVAFFLRGLRDQATEALTLAKGLQNLQAEWRERAMQQSSSTLLILLADLIFEQPILSIPTVAKRLDVTYRTAKKSVEKMIAAGILKQVPDAPKMFTRKVFMAPKLLGLFAETPTEWLMRV
jgi:Fic family protein